MQISGECLICQEYISKLWWERVFANFTSTKSRIALQVARKIAPCDRALIHVCLAYLFLHSGQVLSFFKCYIKRKYLNLIDSNCDVDESCPWFFMYRDCPSLPQPALNVLSIYMWYWAGEISLRWVQFDLLASRDLLRWFGGSEEKGTCTSPSLLGHWHWISAFAYVHWGYQLRISQLNSGVCESFKKTGNGGNLVFGALPLVLGVPDFPKLV